MTKQIASDRLVLLASIGADNGAPTLAIAATGVLTLAANAANGETVTIDMVVYTWKTVLDAGVANQVLIAASASLSIDNLISAINDTGVEGTDYGTGTNPHPTVTAVAGAGDTMDVTAKTVGAAGNTIVTTETMGTGSWGGATLSGGLDVSGIELPGHQDVTKYGVEIKATHAGAFVFDAYLWGLSGSLWVRNGSNANPANIGHVNLGGQLTGTNTIDFREVFGDLGYLDRVYLEVLNFTGTAIEATLIPIEES